MAFFIRLIFQCAVCSNKQWEGFDYLFYMPGSNKYSFSVLLHSVTCSAIIPAEHSALNTKHRSHQFHFNFSLFSFPSFRIFFPFISVFYLASYGFSSFILHFTFRVIIIWIHRYDDVTIPVNQVNGQAPGIDLIQPVISSFFFIFFFILNFNSILIPFLFHFLSSLFLSFHSRFIRCFVFGVGFE